MASLTINGIYIDRHSIGFNRKREHKPRFLRAYSTFCVCEDKHVTWHTAYFICNTASLFVAMTQPLILFALPVSVFKFALAVNVLNFVNNV